MKHEPHEDGDRIGMLEPILIAIGLALAVSLRELTPIWQVQPGLLVLGALTAGAYLVGQAAYARGERRGVGWAFMVAVLVSQPVLLVLWLLDLEASRIVLLAELALLFLAVAWAGARAPRTLRTALALGFACVAALPTLIGDRRQPEGSDTDPFAPRTEYVFSSYHDLSISTHVVLADETQSGGALTLLPDGRVLLVAGSGAARLLDISDNLVASSLALELPIDVAAYRALGRRQPEFYRVFDAVYDRGSLFATYVHWDSEGDCYALRLAEGDFDGVHVGPWVTRFESRPCVAQSHIGNLSGGRIAVLDSSRLLLSTGSVGISASDAPSSIEQSDHGKILELDRETWSHRVFTSGHRNPQGLLVAGDRIWSTEHGPHGGDELNLVRAGSNYGWPFVSYGTDYGKKTLTSGSTPGDHSGYTQPVHSWLPSVGISNLIESSGDLFPRWRGDLLIGALSGLGNGQGLFRVRLVDERVLTAERIPMPGMVRDLLELPGGPLVLWDGRGRVSVVRPADHVFAECAGCHTIRNEQHGIGPDLYGVVGSPVGRHENYQYSVALQSYGGVWTPARLDRFLERPLDEVPGTSMEHAGLADPAARAEVIQFLRELSAGRRTD
jgi:glucose/arabinose dehydrogenase/cytochrome c2